MEHPNETPVKKPASDIPTMNNQPSPSSSGSKTPENLDRPAEGARDIYDDDSMARSESFANSDKRNEQPKISDQDREL